MSLTAIPQAPGLQDGQYIQIAGPDNLLTGYLYNQELRSLYFKESQVIYPAFHGRTHIAEDPVPQATCDTQGLMSPDDKCKLDQLVQMRLGVLGFMGAGFADDAGWMSGDLILAAGSDFLHIERLGNVIRFVVDSPVPMMCSCEECLQLFWLQDESDVSAIRPPTCSGKLPGVNAYGELKVCLYPESTIVDPANPQAALANKANYPAFLFTRYQNSITPGLAEVDLILARNPTNRSTTDVGWSMTPGSSGKAQCVWFMGRDVDGNAIEFELNPATEASGLLGALLYNGHSLTRQVAVIIDYTSTTLTTNQYQVKFWDYAGAAPIGDQIMATNIWRYHNPDVNSGTNARSLTLDSVIDVLPIGTIIDLWTYQIGEVAGTAIKLYLFNQRPAQNPANFWTLVGGVEFGDELSARAELPPGSGVQDKSAELIVSSVDDFESGTWGLSGNEGAVTLVPNVATAGTTGAIDIAYHHKAIIDTDLPGLRVRYDPGTEPMSNRPVMLWNRTGLVAASIYSRIELGRPAFSGFPPYDILLGAPIDSRDDIVLKVADVGQLNGVYFVKVRGAQFNSIPRSGSIRILYQATHTANRHNLIFNYASKVMLPDVNDDGIYLLAGASSNTAYPGEIGDIVELLHRDYTAPCLRLQFSLGNDGSVGMQFRAGMLDMGTTYEDDVVTSDFNDFVRGFQPGCTVSAAYSQDTTWNGIGTPPLSSTDGFNIIDGGFTGGSEGSVESWNVLELMLRGNQLWVWWNGLLIPPSTNDSAELTSPVTVTSPFFPMVIARAYGKFGIKMWPGTTIRRAEVRTQLKQFSEFSFGQLQLQ